MFTFTDLIHAARCFVIDQIVKAAGHKYIKRIPISSNPTKYRYVYSATSTVRGKNILDEAHLKVGTKLMLQSEAGLKRGDTLQYKGKSYSVRSKRNLKGINGFKITLDAKDGSDTMSLKVYPEGVAAADKSPVIVSV